MRCKGINGKCVLESRHLGRCRERLPGDEVWLDGDRNQSVTTDTQRNHVVTAVCNHCVTKDQIIEGLRNQIAEMESKGRAKPKRDRAEYMRNRRAAQKPLGIAHG